MHKNLEDKTFSIRKIKIKNKYNFSFKKARRFCGSLNATVCDQIHQRFYTPLTSQFSQRNVINYYYVI